MRLFSFIFVTMLAHVFGCGQPTDSTQHPVTVRPSQETDGRLIFTTGVSRLADARRAGREAAKHARSGLGEAPAKVVLVFDRTGDRDQMLQGIGEVFAPSLIHGCSSYAPITEAANDGTVGVLAIGGRVSVATVMMPLQSGNYHATGKAIGRSLEPVSTATDDPGKLLLLFGKCHVPMNNRLVTGVRSVLGDVFPIVGGAAADGEWVYYQGRTARRANVAVLLSGDFACGFSTQGADNEQAVAETSKAAVAAAIGAQRDQTLAVFAFNCGGRHQPQGGGLQKEMLAFQEVLGDTPLFGFYGSGEIGPAKTGDPARGVGMHIAACAVKQGEDAGR